MSRRFTPYQRSRNTYPVRSRQHVAESEAADNAAIADTMIDALGIGDETAEEAERARPAALTCKYCGQIGGHFCATKPRGSV